jgi:hypothetical protein
MPSAQVIDLNPNPRTELTPLEKTLGSFSKRIRQNQLETDESDALRDIYSQYQQDGQNLQKTIQEIQTRPGISPTTRVNTINQLLEFNKYNGELQKKAREDVEKLTKNKAIVADLEQRRGLAPGELAAYESDPKMAEQVTRQDKGTQADRPVNEDQLRRIKHITSREDFKKATPYEQNLMLLDGGVSEKNAESIVKPNIEELKNKPGGEYNKMREKAVADYVTNALAQRDSAEELEYTLDTAKKAVQGDIAGPGYEAIIKNNPYGQLMTGLTPDEASLQASNKKLLEGSKGIFGSKPTEREIFLLLNSMLPAIGKTKEANLASLYFIEKLNSLKVMHGDLVADISKNGYVPDIESQVNQRMKPMIQEFRDELKNGVKALEEEENNKPIKVTSPSGTVGFMTQSQIKAAKEKNVIFTPAK